MTIFTHNLLQASNKLNRFGTNCIKHEKFVIKDNAAIGMSVNH